jgi:hypothetical protein
MDDGNQIERDAREMIAWFGDAAVYLARDLAERAEGRRGEVAQAWHDIADAIDRLSTAPSWACCPAQRNKTACCQLDRDDAPTSDRRPRNHPGAMSVL